MMKLEYLIVLLSILGCKNSGSKDTDAHIYSKSKQTICIERIFEQDSILGGIRNRAPQSTTLSEAVITYTNNLESLDYTNCPDDFVQAFQQHIDAWKKITIITDNYPSLRGELHDVFSEVELTKDSTRFKALVKRIWDTWAEVEKSAD